MFIVLFSRLFGNLREKVILAEVLAKVIKSVSRSACKVIGSLLVSKYHTGKRKIADKQIVE